MTDAAPAADVDLDTVIEALDSVYARLTAAPVAVRAEGLARLYRVLKSMTDTVRYDRGEALYDYLAGLVEEDVRTFNEVCADLPDHVDQEVPDLLEDDGGPGWMAWHNTARRMAWRPAMWTVRIGGRVEVCYRDAGEVFAIASRVRSARILRRTNERARAARKRGIEAPS